MKNTKIRKLLSSLCVAALIMGVVLVYTGGLTACNDVSDKIEIVEEPQMTRGTSYNGYFPIISVKVKNKTNSTINVGIDCTIYDTNGKHPQKISSLFFEIAAGDTETLWAKSNLAYRSSEFSLKSFTTRTYLPHSLSKLRQAENGLLKWAGMIKLTLALFASSEKLNASVIWL